MYTLIYFKRITEDVMVHVSFYHPTSGPEPQNNERLSAFKGQSENSWLISAMEQMQLKTS